jgi:hypothetical protein
MCESVSAWHEYYQPYYYGIVKLFIHGADIAFDRRTLTDYFAGRLCTYAYFLIANKLASAVAKVKSVFTPSFAFAPIAA